MHFAKITKSERLKKVLSLLKRGGRYSTFQIIEACKVCAVNSIIAELRCNGYNINCYRSKGVFEYELQNN